jgi:2-isopropylmalate synthase
MISDTIAYFKAKNKEVIFDAEHFFDGYNQNPEYALKTITTAAEAGADCITLCDTRGATLPFDIESITKAAIEHLSAGGFKCVVGIHTHNDIGCAVSSSMAAVCAGARHVQGTILGFGERCGNANLSTIIPNLQLKMGYSCIPKDKIASLHFVCAKIAEITNINLDKSMPYIGKSAFAHKAGMHTDGVIKAKTAFEHIDPKEVGGERRFLISEMAGKSVILNKILKFDKNITKNSEKLDDILLEVKAKEALGYSFEGAGASFELMAKAKLGLFSPNFEVINYMVVANSNKGLDHATIKIKVGTSSVFTGAEGRGPVNALDRALRQALLNFFPHIKNLKLTDYKVRIIDGKKGTAAITRVLIDFQDKDKTWTTIGVSDDIITASLMALKDSYEYSLTN